jgi:hypothetical protein
MIRLVIGFVIFSSALTVQEAWAGCGECRARDSFGICEPIFGCQIGKTITQAETLAQALASGDPKKIETSIGAVLVSSNNCIGCIDVAHRVLPGLSDSQIEMAVGEGFMTYVSTGSVEFVALDTAGNVATSLALNRSAAHTPGPGQGPGPAKPPRPHQTYSAQAVCIATYTDGSVYAGFLGPAILIDTSGQSHQFPNVDFYPGDTLKVSAPSCPSWNDPTHGLTTVLSATLSYTNIESEAGDPADVKWFIIGTKE